MTFNIIRSSENRPGPRRLSKGHSDSRASVVGRGTATRNEWVSVTRTYWVGFGGNLRLNSLEVMPHLVASDVEEDKSERTHYFLSCSMLQVSGTCPPQVAWWALYCSPKAVWVCQAPWGTHPGRASPSQAPGGHRGEGPPSQTPVQLSVALSLAPGSGSSPQRHGTVPAPTAAASAVLPSAFPFPALAAGPHSGQILLLPSSTKEEQKLGWHYTQVTLHLRRTKLLSRRISQNVPLLLPDFSIENSCFPQYLYTHGRITTPVWPLYTYYSSRTVKSQSSQYPFQWLQVRPFLLYQNLNATYCLHLITGTHLAIRAVMYPNSDN